MISPPLEIPGMVRIFLTGLDYTDHPGYPCSTIANGDVRCCVYFIIQWLSAVPEVRWGQS